MEIIETHAHIYAEEFDNDRDEVIERASEVGVSKILMPNVNSESIDRLLATEQKYASCLAQMGLHPCYVKDDFEKELAVVETWLNERDFVAVGEIGIDYHWDKTFKEQQFEAFEIQIDWAIEKDIPIVIHSRDSTADVLKVLEKKKHDKLRGVFHCFGGSVEEAKAIIDLNFHVGLGGVTTFKNSGMKGVIPHIEANRIVLETDCPYLAPVPNRGKRNEPKFLSDIAQFVADCKEMSLEKLTEQTTQNARNLFDGI